MRLFAPAKVNLGLEITGRREDGYHDVVSVLETVSIFDVIDVSHASRLEVRSPVECADQEDLVRTALRRLEQRCSVRLPLRVAVQKGIPVAAGLGGGSSDAGTVLAAVARVLDLDATVVHDVAASLGSDVPFFLRGGTALAGGTGTDLRPIQAQGRRWYVVVVPKLRIPEKTRQLYRELTPDDFSDGSATRDIAGALASTGDVDPRQLVNAFQRPLLERPEFEAASNALLSAGSRVAMPAGAGPSVFGLFGTYTEAARVASRIDRAAGHVYVATTVRAGLNHERIARAAGD